MRNPITWLVSATLMGIAPVALGQAVDVPPARAEKAADSSLEAALGRLVNPAGLKADQVAERSLRTSPGLFGKQKAVHAAEASVAEARSNFFPQLTASARYTRLSEITPPAISLGGGTGGTVVTTEAVSVARPVRLGEQLTAVPFQSFSFPIVLDNVVFQATLNIPLSDYVLRLADAVNSASESKVAAEWDEKASRLSLARDAKVAYYQWIAAQGAEIVAERALVQVTGHRVDAKNAFGAGLVSKADVLRAESAVKSAELFLERARNAVHLMLTRLQTLMHDSSASAYLVGENLLDPLPPMDLPREPDQEAAAQRLELRVLDASERATRKQIGLAETKGYPRLDAQASAVYANPNQRFFPADGKYHATWDASVVLSWTPTNWFGAVASANVAEARAAELASKRVELLDGLRMEVTQSMDALKEATFAIDSSKQTLAAAEEGYRVRQELFRVGKSTEVELTDARTELIRAQMEVINAHVQLRVARAQLDHALGRDAVRLGYLAKAGSRPEVTPASTAQH